MENRLLTINIRKYLVTQPRTKRVKKAVKYIRNRIAHYTKIAEENVRMTQELNSMILKQYARSMVPVKLNISIDKGIASAAPFGVQPKQQVQTAAADAGAAKAKEKNTETGPVNKEAQKAEHKMSQMNPEKKADAPQKTHAPSKAEEATASQKAPAQEKKPEDKAARREKANEGRK